MSYIFKRNTIKAAATLCLINYALCINISCSTNDDTTAETNAPVALQVSAGIGDNLTRAVGAKWSESDAIGVRVTSPANSDYKNVKYTIDELSNDQTTADFQAASTPIFFQSKDEQVTLAAYAPYSESEPNALPGTDGKITFKTSKYNGSTEDQEKIDFIYASGATATFDKPKAEFTTVDEKDYSFHHKMSRMVLTFKAGNGFNSSDILSTDDNLKFTFSLGGLSHDGTFDVTTGEAKVTKASGESAVMGSADWDITECVKTDDKESRTYTLILFPQDLSSAPLTLKAVTGGQTYENSTTIAPNLEAGKSYAYTITVNKTALQITSCTISDWDNGNGENGETGEATMK